MKRAARQGQGIGERLVSHFVVVLLAAIWGSTWPAIKYGLAFFPPFWFASLRFILTGGVLFGCILLFRLPRLQGRHAWRVVFVLGVVMVAIPYGLQFWSQQFISSGLGGVLISTVPFFVLLFGLWLLPHERAGPIAIVGLVVGFGGIAYIFRDSLFGGGTMAPWGVAGILACAASIGYGTVIARRDARDLHPTTMTALQMLIGAAFLIAFTAAVEHDVQFRVSARPPGPPIPGAVNLTLASFGLIAYIGLIGSGLSYILYYWVIQRVPALEASLISFGVPITANLFAVWWLNETLSPGFVAGAMVTLTGVALVSLSRRNGSTQVGE
jgi:drug/metabolite transporter (DMT)-like permease